MPLRSAAKLNYNDAQAFIDGKSPNITVIPEHSIVGVAQDIKLIDDLAKQLRFRRFQTGCLQSESLRLTFSLDEDGHPVDCGQDARTQANKLVEEVCFSCQREICIIDK